jgi:hypothetical protein
VQNTVRRKNFIQEGREEEDGGAKMTVLQEAIVLTEQMTLAEKVKLLEHLSIAMRHDLELEAFKHIPWEQFLALTYGSLADDPIERNQPLTADVRDEIE